MKKIKSVILIFSLIFLFSISTSKSSEFGHWDKGQLDYFCNNSSDMEKILCLGYITGSLETITSAFHPGNKGLIPLVIPCGKDAVYKYTNAEWMELIKIEVKRTTHNLAIHTVYETVGKYGCQ